MTRRVLEVLLAFECAGIAWLTLNPSPARPSSAVLNVSDLMERIGAPERLADPAVWEFLLNVLLFVPLTMLGTWRWPRVRIRTWALVGLVISCLIELTQALWLPDRSGSVRDLISNTTGAAIGALLARWSVRVWVDRPSSHQPIGSTSR